jgi:hypothetical protein
MLNKSEICVLTKVKAPLLTFFDAQLQKYDVGKVPIATGYAVQIALCWSARLPPSWPVFEPRQGHVSLGCNCRGWR